MTTVDDLEALRRPLSAYCYRLLGAAGETEDAVQETLIRASARLDRYDPARARLSTWVHRIATNVCLDLLRGASRRALAVDLGPASDGTDLGVPLSPDRFVEPMPDSRLLGVRDPADLVTERETLRLAFVAALQWLPPRQRAALLLRDVLAFSAQETADVLDCSVPAANSALQRARATLEQHRPRPAEVLDPDDAEQQGLVRRYVAAFESHDVEALTALLREDATASMPPFTWWLRGGAAIARLMGDSDACAGDRLVPTVVNGSPGFGQYRSDERGVLRPFALIALDLLGGRIAHLTTFLGSGHRFAEFGLADSPSESSVP